MRVIRIQLSIVFIATMMFWAIPVKAAEYQDRDISLGIGVHLTSSLSDVCDKDGDVIGCMAFFPVAGLDINAQWWPSKWFAIGLRLAGSKDLDRSESVSSNGESQDRDAWLWLISAEGRFAPAIFPSGMWVGVEAGVAFLVDSLDWFGADGENVKSKTATQWAPLIGAVLGWDFSLTEALYLGVDLRASFIAFGGDPPQLQPKLYAREFGNAVWLGAGLRLLYQQ